MAKLYEVKQSPGKGHGVFTTQSIASGTTIIHDKTVMKLVAFPGVQLSHQQVRQAFTQLSTDDQSEFLKLHEGNRPLQTKLLRIYKANAFGNDKHQWINIVVSKINHSCVPNAEFLGPNLEGEVRVVAVKPIEKGEEISICYNDVFEGATKSQRNNTFKTCYNFTCTCPACTMGASHTALSDARRCIIRHLSYKLLGYEPPSFSFMDGLNSLTAETPAFLAGQRVYPLRTALTIYEETAYNFLLARLREAEGLKASSVADAHANAAQALLSKMSEIDGMVVLPAAQNVIDWMTRAVTAMDTARGSASPEAEQMRWVWSEMQRHGPLSVAKQYVS